jgi:uncharacterized protein (TIGR00255 family)
MTGFARADGEHQGVRWHWEVKTVNGKALDVRCRLPSGFDGLEQQVRDLVGRHVRRGNCQVSLQIQRDTAAGGMRINEDVLDQVIAAIELVRTRCDTTPPTPEGILALRGVLEIAEPAEWLDDEEMRAAMTESLSTAMVDLVASRRAEGSRLSSIVADQVTEISRLTDSARNAAARRPDAIRARIADQVAKLTDASPALDPDRLHQEAVMLATRVDVQEEIDRLGAHVDAAGQLLNSGDPAGRKLDFLTQEFIREANTLCSKANDPSLTAIGLDLKAAIDQMREQVQNIE